jgi:hypothetical protein
VRLVGFSKRYFGETAPGDVEIGAMAEELRELLVDMQAKVEKKLNECGNT